MQKGEVQHILMAAMIATSFWSTLPQQIQGGMQATNNRMAIPFVPEAAEMAKIDYTGRS
jgi:hypothetical protein